MKNRLKKWIPYLLITFVLTGLSLYFYTNGVLFLDSMELKTIDLRFLARGQVSPGPEVVLAVIDEKSIAREGKWVWPRSKIAQLIRKLSEKKARVIAFDIVFSEPDQLNLVKTIEEIEWRMKDLEGEDEKMRAFFNELKLRNDYDRQLADAIADSKSRVVLGYFFQLDPNDVAHVSDEEILRHMENVRNARLKMARFTSEDAKDVPLVEAVYPQSNIGILSDAADYAGFFNMFPDTDGVVRRVPTVVRFNDSLYAPLSIMALSAYFDEEPSVLIADYGVAELSIGDYFIPTDEFGLLLINYRGPARTFPHVSVTDILNDEVSEELIRDKIVFVGATATGIYDLRVTPYSSVYPGLEIHANVTDSILSQDFLYQPEFGRMFNLLSIAVSGVLLGLILPATGMITGAILALLLFSGYMALCQYLFSAYGWILNLIYPLSGMALIYVSITSYRFLTESRQKRFIKDAFSTYLAPSVVKQLIESPENLVLGGEEREITAFFSDVQGFTSISERLSPKELVDLLNEFLTEMTNYILEMEGTVDKFEGDAIIAFFGAPNLLPDHAARACTATVMMQKRLSELRRKWAQENRPLLHMRVGINTGYAVVGNMGSRNRMDYTMMGDTVNTAARLEGVNKVYRTYSMISQATCSQLKDGLYARELDSINVVGKGDAVVIYQLVGFETDLTDPMKRGFELYAKGLSAYRKREWEKAASFFGEVLDLCPEDGPSITMKQRSLQYVENPPPEDWNGAYVMTQK